MKRIILLCGRKRTGKGTIFNIAKPFCYNSGELFFAKPIKEFCINALGLTYEQMYGATEQRESPTDYKWSWVSKDIREKYKKSPEEYLTARQVLQVVGTDVMRNHFDQDVWAKAGARQVTRSEFETCFFTDTRMKNELYCTKNLVANHNIKEPLIIRVYRHTNLEDSHESECDLDIFDAVPEQHSAAQGIPDGFYKLTDRLWTRISTSNPFNYILDNNGTVQETDESVRIILHREQIK